MCHYLDMVALHMGLIRDMLDLLIVVDSNKHSQEHYLLPHMCQYYMAMVNKDSMLSDIVYLYMLLSKDMYIHYLQSEHKYHHENLKILFLSLIIISNKRKKLTRRIKAWISDQTTLCSSKIWWTNANITSCTTCNTSTIILARIR